jgi:hypothetical protein
MIYILFLGHRIISITPLTDFGGSSCSKSIKFERRVAHRLSVEMPFKKGRRLLTASTRGFSVEDEPHWTLGANGVMAEESVGCLDGETVVGTVGTIGVTSVERPGEVIA